MNKNTIGLILGTFFGIVHVFWALLVAIGLAQPLMNFIFDIHFINNPYQIIQFDLGKALLLVIVTFAIGYIFGWIFAAIWNKLLREERR